MAVKNLGGSQQLLAGQGDIIVFSAPTGGYTSSTTLAQVLTNGASLGQVVQDSTSWDGEQVSFSQILDEQGDVITSRATNGTHQVSFDLADLEADFIAAFLGAESITVAASGASAVFKDGTVTCYGFGHKLPVKVRPLMITNDEGNRAIFFPKAKMAASLSWSDNLWRLHVVATAEFMDSAALKTCMILSSTTGVDYADGSITAATLDGTTGDVGGA